MSAAPRTSPRLFFTVKEVAEIWRGSPQSVHNRIAAGDLESVKPGRQRLIPRKALAAFLGLDPSELPA